MTEWFLNDSKWLNTFLLVSFAMRLLFPVVRLSLCLQMMKYVKHGINLNFKWMWLLWKSALKGFHFFTALFSILIYVYVYILRNYGVSIKFQQITLKMNKLRNKKEFFYNFSVLISCVIILCTNIFFFSHGQ